MPHTFGLLFLRNKENSPKPNKSLLVGSFSRDPGSGLAEVLALRCFLLRCWMASFLFELVGLPLCFVGFCSFL